MLIGGRMQKVSRYPGLSLAGLALLLLGTPYAVAQDAEIECTAHPSQPEGYIVQSTHALPTGCESYAIRPQCAEKIICGPAGKAPTQEHNVVCPANRDAKTCPLPTECFKLYQAGVKNSNGTQQIIKADESCQRADGGDGFTATVIAQAANPGPGAVPSKCDLAKIAPICVATASCASGAEHFLICHTESCGTADQCMSQDLLFPPENMGWGEFKSEANIQTPATTDPGAGSESKEAK